MSCLLWRRQSDLVAVAPMQSVEPLEAPLSGLEKSAMVLMAASKMMADVVDRRRMMALAWAV